MTTNPVSPQAAQPVMAVADGRELSTPADIVLNIVGSILILGLGVFGLIFFGARPEVAQDKSKLNAAALAPLVETAEVAAWDKPFRMEIDGEAATYRVLTVGAEVSGRVKTKSPIARSGSFVNKGDVLFQVDPLNYELDLDRLQARVNQARQELESIDVDIKNTEELITLAREENTIQKSHLERVKSLMARKATSETELDNASQQELTSRNALQTQENQLRSLQQMVKTKESALKLAEAELERVKVDLQRCEIVAPITGRVVDDMKEEGDYVKPGDELLHLSDSSRMEVKCSLKDDELAWIWQHGLQMNAAPLSTSESLAAEATKSEAGGSKTEETRKLDPVQMPKVPCEVVFDFEGVETTWDGYLSRYEGTGIDRATRMFPCRVTVDEPEKTRTDAATGITGVTPPVLMSGMYVTVRIPIDSTMPLLSVPAEAVRPGEQLWAVRDGKLRVVQVRVVRVEEETVLVRQESGSLQPGDHVITSPLAAIQDGMSVSVQNKTKTPEVSGEQKTGEQAANNAKEVQR